MRIILRTAFASLSRAVLAIVYQAYLALCYGHQLSSTGRVVCAHNERSRVSPASMYNSVNDGITKPSMNDKYIILHPENSSAQCTD